MSSDADYTAFLEKSQKDYSGGQSTAQQKEDDTTVSTLENAPAAIKALGERFYTSETDERFGSVEFPWNESQLPDGSEPAHPLSRSSQLRRSDQFAKLAGAETADVLDPAKWAGGQYIDVAEAVVKAGNGGGAKVYRVGRAGSRVEYFVLTLADNKLVGVKAKAVES